MDKGVALRKLRDEGYTRFLSWEDKPGKRYKPHFHFKASKIFVLKGSMKVTIGDRAKNYVSGDSVFVPKKTRHSAVVGISGGEFLEGQK
ncbi:MAG: cupin domain-containing protein [Candidatus Micrarchaeota archaeon]|nr:cupin domain-containing protein [Candidatus Micrarchaeota archaeon]MDE1849199.1 cupin domain-containing protein [Candidatus Micrarchaeota archaeon]